MTAPTTSPVAALADALGGRTVDHFGDTRVLVHADLIYCAPNGTVKLDHRGRITVLGTWSTPTEELVAAYRREVRR